MATGRSQDAICRIVKDRTLELETKAGYKPYYDGIAKMEGMLVTVDWNARNLQVHNGHDGKLITSHRLKYPPSDVCLISKNEVAVCLGNGTVVILSLKSIDDVKLVKTLQTGFYYCDSLAKWKSDKLIVSGNKDGMLCWGILSIRDGRMDSTHDICKGYRTRMAVKDNTVYISCLTSDSITNGIHVYDILKPKTKKFLYRHQELAPWSIMADRDYVYVCDWNSNRIHQLTDSGQLVTIHTVSSSLLGIFYDDQQRLLYTTSKYSNVITIYKMESLHQPGTGIPAEILNMDDRSIQLFENALKDGKEKVYSIRVMVVGHQGVGKTTLIKRLLGKDVNISERQSTEGIDVHLHCCDVSLSSHEWTLQKKESEQDYRLQRLAKVLIEKQVRSEAADEKQVVIFHEGAIADISAQDHVAEEPDIVSPHPDLLKTSQQIGSSGVLRNLPKSNANTMVISEPGENISSESHMKDPNREILQLLQKNADKIKNDLGTYAPLTMWDFAGQYAFYTTHQMFLSRRAIYLLVSDLSGHIDDIVDDELYFDEKGKMECRVRELVEVWMNSVHSCASADNESMNSKVIPPPVMLVGTHADAIQEDNRHEICENYFREIRYHLKDKPSRFHLVEEDFAIDNTVVDSKLKGLKRKIVEVASQQPYWGEEIPARWLPLEQVLMNLRAQGHKVIHRSLLENINQAGGLQVSTDEMDLFLRFQHEIGTILYFSTELLKEKIVLEPQWMINALKSLITAEMFVLRHALSVTTLWYEFKNGKLYPKLIDALWTKDENADLHDNKDHLLLLMEQLNIIAKPKLYIDDESEIKEVNYFFAPCMVHAKPPRKVIFPENHEHMETSSVMCYVFTGKFLPAPIFHRLLAACIAQWPLATKQMKTTLENQIFCGCGVFQIDNCHKLTLYFSGYIIFMRVTRQGIKDKTPSSKLCIEVKEFIAKVLNKLIGYLGHSLKFEEFIQCPEYNDETVNSNSLFPVAKLKVNAEVRCDFHDNIIESNKILKFWFDGEEQTVMEGFEEGKESKVSKKEENASMDRVLSTSIKKGVPCSNPFVLCQLLQKSQQAALSSQSTLVANCLSVGLVFHGETPANGNCFFEAVSSQLRRLNGVVQKSPQQLRQEVVAFMKTNRVIQASEGTSHLDSFVDESFDVYCMRMARDGEWADHVVVVAMARMLQIDIMIVTSSPSSGPEDIIVWVVGQTAFQKDPILLGHVWESHYLSLQPIAPVVLDQDLAVHSTQAQTAHIMQIPASGSTSSTTLGLIQTPTTNASPSIFNGSTSSTTPNCTTSDVLQISISSFAMIDVMQAPISESTTADIMQIPVSTFTTADVMPFVTSLSTLSTDINGLVQMTGSTTSLISTTDGVMQTATPSFIRTDLVQASVFGSTTAVMQAPTSVPTTTNILLATTSASTPSTTIGFTPCPTSTLTTSVMQKPTSVPTATNVLLATTSGSTPSTTTGSILCPSPTSATDVVMQAPTSGSTTTDIMQASSSGSKLSTTTGSTLCPTFTSTTANLMQASTSASTTNIMQSPSSGSTTNATQDPSSGSTAANVIQTPTSGSTAANVIQAPTSGSTAANVIQTPTSGSTTSGSKPSTTAGLMPVLSSCYSAGGLQPQATSSIQSTTPDVMQAPSLDDTGRFVHIACLLVDVGSRVLRRLLLYHTVKPTRTLDQYLAKNRIDIDNLRKRRILNKSQMDILFPPGGSTNLGDYDITLLSALFTNIVLTISQQDLNMIQFLRDKRNEIFAHAKSVTVNSNDYQTFWNDICRTLEALSKQCNDPDFENEISREIQGIQVSTVQGTSLLDALQTHKKMETLERLVQYLMSSNAQESNKESDDSNS